MTLSISVNSRTEQRLRELAQAAGKDVASYAAQIVEQAAAKSTLDEVLAPLRQEFAQSGTTEQQLLEEIESAKAAYRAERLSKQE